MKALLERDYEKELRIRSLDYNNGKFVVELQHDGIEILAATLAEYFRQTGAINYIEVLMTHEDLGPFVVTMQRLNGKTPHQLRKEAEEKLQAITTGATP